MKRFTFLFSIMVMLLVSGLIASPAGAATINLNGAWVAGTTHTTELGGDRALIFIAHAESTSAVSLNTVTYGGQAMTKVVDLSSNVANGWAYAGAYILDEAGIAAASDSTFTVTWNGSNPGSNAAYSSAFFQNVDQITPTGATDTFGSNINPITTSALATSIGDMVILAATCGNAGSFTLNNGFIEGIEHQAIGSGGEAGVTGHKPATGADETPSATFDGSVNRQMIIGFVLKAAAGPGAPTYILSVSPASLDVTAATNSTATFSVTSDTSWTVSSNQTWLTVSPASGSNNETVTVTTAEENLGTIPRTATVTVAATGTPSQTVTVTQAPVLAVSPTLLSIAAEANSTCTFNVASITSWTVSTSRPGFTVSPTSGSNNGTVTVTAEQNTNPLVRTATITVSTGVATQNVTVTQSAGGECVPPMPPFSSLVDNPKFPDPFTFMDGSPVTTMAEWTCRRAEIAALVQEFELGYKEYTPYSATTGSMSGSSIVVTVNDNGTTINFSCSITYPATGSPPYPAVIGIGGSSLNSSALSSLGVAVINFPNGTVAQQNNQSSRGVGLFYNMYGSGHSASAMMAWAWGLDRLIDALEKTPAANIDPTRLATTGCSRNGKGALICGAFCERIKLTIPQESGSAGASSWRVAQYQLDVLGENVQTLCQIVTENVWLRQNFSQFCGSVNKVPIDQHEIMALCAPRALLVIENSTQEWLGNLSTWTTGNAAHLVWEAMGIPDKMGYSQVGNHGHCAFPASQQPEVTAYIQKFLVGGGTADTNIMYTDGLQPPNLGGYFDVNSWVDWVDWEVPNLGPDNAPPMPDPMTWVVPYAISSATSITMTATSATDVTLVQYLFECTNDATKSSGWQGSPTYVATGLERGTEYSFRVKARDSDPVPYETEWSSVLSATTLEANVDTIGLWLPGLTHAAEPGIGRGLVFFAHAERTTIAPFGPTSVTYGGQPMTKIVDVNVGTTGSVVCAAAFWLSEAGIADATDGNFTVTWSDTPTSTVYDSVFLEGVNQTTPIGARDSNGTTTGATITTSPLSTNEGDMVIDAATCSTTGSYTVNNGFIEAQELSISSADAVNGYKGFKQAAGGDETPSVTHSSSTNRQVLLGFVVKANHQPKADAGDSQSVAVSDLVTLDGSGSSDVDGDTLTYQWAFTSVPVGSAAVLNDPDTVSPSFIPDVPGIFEVSLIVDDGTLLSKPDIVTVSVVTRQTWAIQMAQYLMDTINALDENVFNNLNNKKALTNKLNAVINQLETDNYDGAINKLQNDLLGKTDGCAEIGKPDKNDWLLDCNAQAVVYPLIVELIDYLQNM